MKKQLDEDIPDNLFERQLQQSETPKPFLSLNIQDTVQKGAPRHYTRLDKMVFQVNL